ncbi:ribonuclease domain-containing protein [Stenotrophomonas maltophilia]|uniref:Ribonuclease n=1 Tax=Stenotrophomonas forensis TaxID=2871169 RepID=A0ABY7XXG3_9GAMM|nr:MULTISPECIES: ribonuclease domain-containing protein [Stenotrophomonas]ALA83194.1 ribonuclease [Stenotrophomonas maltophilia]MBH1479169.1 ribonuclease [Stenotrophomonas maltophilia]MBH1505190.1 ribonuclease [Stenotrophomonas maltophilia]MBH1787074.1 ribonuclease [Stenotrophomonas maltophilia]WDM62414.1 ribonuclease [Stenotrophomonas sp. DFS-20110405]
MRNPRLLITAIALLLLGLVANHFMQRAPAPQFAPELQGAPAAQAPATPAARADGGLPAFLPAEARQTIALIQRGGPFPHRQDGSTFGNREQQLPQRARGYYREYTVDTPGARTRGTRRIVTGGDPPEAWYYTDDHYESFRSFTVPAQGAQ